ncbi:MAG: hypothetical protein JEZ09_04080 [Salinivirgaceae bacterium]|nr:hypothetical protein [Salinivirgaceae bacterium]
MKILIVILLLIAFGKSVYSFTFPPHHSLLNNSSVKDSNALYLNFYNSNFLWNNEFFNDVVEGYTLIGYFITPQFEYHFSPNIKIDAGVHLLKYTGVDDFTRFTPTYSVTFSKRDFSLIMGTIKGTINHRLPEPILFTEKYFTNNLENGVQYIVDKERLFSDVWLDWQNFIFPKDNEQEKLVAGFSLDPYFVKNEKWEFSTPVGGIAGHRGGQIDTSQANMKTVINYNFGLKATKLLTLKYLKRITLESSYLKYVDNSPTVESLYKKGSGYFSNIRLGFDDNYLQFGYWYSNQFLSLLGHPIYQSFSEKSEEQHQKYRELISANIFYSKTIYKGIYLGFMGDVFYDLRSGDTDYSMGLTLIIKNNFFIKRFKNNPLTNYK